MRGKPWVRRWSLLVLILWVVAVPAASAFAENLRFVVFGDSRGSAGGGPPINETELSFMVQQIVALNPKPVLAVFGGDLALRADNWDRWKTLTQPLTDAGITLFVAKGNHELYDNKVKCRLVNQAAYQKFVVANYPHIPTNGPPGFDRLAYSFEYGNSLFIVLDSFYMTPDSKVDKMLYGGITWQQLAWLDGLLANTVKEHRFIFSHMPAYPVNWAKPRDSSLDDLWKIMDVRRITLFFASHEHLYDRWFIDSSVDPDWTRSRAQIITGCAGGPFSQPPVVKDPKKYNHPRHTTYNKNNYVVVDVKGEQVTWITFGGTKKGGYTQIDSGP